MTKTMKELYSSILGPL